MMQLCSRCRKRMAVVFVTKLENGESKNEGLCLKCARELGIPQVDSILSGMGISNDDLENMEDEMTSLITQGAAEAEAESDDDEEEAQGRTPAMDFAKLFGNLPFMNNGNLPTKKEADGESEKKDGAKGKEKTKDKKKKSAVSFQCIAATSRRLLKRVSSMLL